jgi:CDP-glucose 4,6-dehydratase
VLELCRQCPETKAVVVISTDKVYANKEWHWGYREEDDLGDSSPYGASKVCVGQVINCYRTHYFPMIATARAGNVIGGGDWAHKRLIPDIVRATAHGDPVEIHTPNATRPWQHVLEPLSGYLTLGQKLLEKRSDVARPWNFGPEGEMTVLDIVKLAKEEWPEVKYNIVEEETHPSMVQLLKIDSTLSKEVLGWKPRWNMEAAVRNTIRWYKKYYEENEILTKIDIKRYEEA